MKNKISWRNVIILVLASLLIISSGIMVPFALMRLKTRPANLPHGEVDSENIQPYGADTIRLEKSINSALDTYKSNRKIIDKPSSTWVARKENNFEEIGIQQRLYDEGNPRAAEFIDLLDDAITENIGESGFGDSIIVSSTKDDLEDEHLVYRISAQDNNTIVILDGETGIPIFTKVSVISPNFADRGTLRSQIIQLYQEYTGMSFVIATSDPGYIDEYDSNYYYEIESADHSMKLYIQMTSGWYWLPPNSSSEDWQPTNNYLWEITVYVNDYDVDYAINQIK